MAAGTCLAPGRCRREFGAEALPMTRVGFCGVMRHTVAAQSVDGKQQGLVQGSPVSVAWVITLPARRRFLPGPVQHAAGPCGFYPRTQGADGKVSREGPQRNSLRAVSNVRSAPRRVE